MALLEDIQKEALDSSVNINDLLRKCKVLAVRLGNDDFKTWVDNELNGYASEDELPQYRKVSVRSYGHFRNSAWDYKHVQIPISVIPEEWREFASNAYFLDSISYFQHLLSSGSDDEQLRQEWPSEWASEMSYKVYSTMGCLDAWKEIPRATIEAVIDKVRTKILDFVLEIEALDPSAGDDPQQPPNISPEQVKNIFNITIHGGLKNLAAGEHATAQSIEYTVIENDLESLAKFLEAQGIGREDVAELQEAIEKDNITKEQAKKGFGEKVGGWIGKTVGKAASGALKIGTTVAAMLLTEAIKKYYGIG